MWQTINDCYCCGVSILSRTFRTSLQNTLFAPVAQNKCWVSVKVYLQQICPRTHRLAEETDLWKPRLSIFFPISSPTSGICNCHPLVATIPLDVIIISLRIWLSLKYVLFSFICFKFLWRWDHRVCIHLRPHILSVHLCELRCFAEKMPRDSMGEILQKSVGHISQE